MSRVSRRFSIVGSLALMTAMLVAANPVVEEISGDLKILQGTWGGTSPDGTSVTFEFKEKVVVTTLGDMVIESTISLDEKAEPHKTIDFKIESGPPDIVGLTAPAIYKLDVDGKKITVCSAHPGAERPRDFQDEEGVSMLFELTKESD